MQRLNSSCVVNCASLFKAWLELIHTEDSREATNEP